MDFDALRATLATNLRTRRKELGLSQERLALDAEIDRTFVSQIERGISNPSLRILFQLAEQLDTEVTTLLVAPPKSKRR
jgi:transcriptional regulator with XRE-family HTH domain